MPLYTFRNKVSGEIITDVSVRISEYDDYLQQNAELERYFQPSDAPATVSGVGGIKTDSGFKEVLSKISDAHPGSQLSDRHSAKSIKQAKTDQVINKHFGN